MNFSEHKIKRFSLIFLAVLMLVFSGCGVTVETLAPSTSVSSVTTTAVSDTGNEENSTDKTSKEAASTTAKTTTAAKSAATAAVGKTTAKTTTAKKTEPTASTKKQPTAKTVSCTVEIECKTIYNNLGDLRPEKKPFLPKSGVILKQKQFTVPDGSTVFDVIKKACAESVCTDNCNYCRKSGIQIEYVYTPGYDSEYIRGIHQIYEKDCGSGSGWMYSVNGVFPNYGVNKYTVKNGDVIRFLYTCDLGDDVGGHFS